MTSHAPDHANAPGARTKGLHLPPNRSFAFGDLSCELYADREADGRWCGHVSVFETGTRRRVDRFTLEGSRESFDLLAAAARTAVERRLASARSPSMLLTVASDSRSCGRA